MYSNEIKQEVKKLFCNGWRVKAIAEKLNLKVGQVEYVIKDMRNKGEKLARWWK